jgi:hypothetical protein
LWPSAQSQLLLLLAMPVQEWTSKEVIRKSRGGNHPGFLL